MGEIKITYETLFDILRRERSREELQKLDDTFFDDVTEYLKEKQAILSQSSDQSELFKASEAEKTRIQLHNIRKILKELYEARERKIINRAVNKVKTGSDIIDTSALLGQEQLLFQELSELLAEYKKKILIGLVNGDAAAPSVQSVHMPTPVAAAETQEPMPETATLPAEPANEPEPAPGPEENPDEKPEEAPVEEETKPAAVPEPAPGAENMTVRFMHALPKFVGRNQEVFGPFAEDEVSTLPTEIARILVKKGRAEEITL